MKGLSQNTSSILRQSFLLRYMPFLAVTRSAQESGMSLEGSRFHMLSQKGRHALRQLLLHLSGRGLRRRARAQEAAPAPALK
jgi:hypothetical protein